MRSSYILCSTVILLLLWMKTEIALEASKIKTGVEILMKFYKPCVTGWNSTNCFREKTVHQTDPAHTTNRTLPQTDNTMPSEDQPQQDNVTATKRSHTNYAVGANLNFTLIGLVRKIVRLFSTVATSGKTTNPSMARSSEPADDQRKDEKNSAIKGKKVQKDASEYSEDNNYTEEDMQFEPDQGHEGGDMGYAGEEEELEMEEPEEETEEEDEDDDLGGGGGGYMRPIAMNMGALMTKPSMEPQKIPNTGSVSLKKEPSSMMSGMSWPMRPMQMMPLMGAPNGGEMLMPLKSGDEDDGGQNMVPMMMMMMPPSDSSHHDKHKHKDKHKNKKKKKKKKKHKKKKESAAAAMMADKMDGGGEGGGMMPDPSTMMKMGMVGVGGMVLLILKAITLISGKAVLASTIALTLSVIMALKALFNSVHAHPPEGADKVMTYMKKPIHINADAGYPDYRNYHGSDWGYHDSSYFPTKKSGKLPEYKIDKLKRTDKTPATLAQTELTTGSPVNPFDFNPETYSSANIINYKSGLNNSGISQFYSHSVPLYTGYAPINS